MTSKSKSSKQIFVTGITGNQGSAVARYLLDMGHSVIGLTRDASSDKAQQWKNKGVTIVQGDLDHPFNYGPEMAGSDAIFLVQSLQKKDGEIKQGKTFVDAVVKAGTKHLVYSSVLGADLNTGVPHFESKNVIEGYIKASGVNYTFLRPASFYENCLFPQVADGIMKGKFVSPLNASCRQQMIGVDDIGKIAAQVISNGDKYSGQTLSIATDEYQIGDLPEVFSEAIKKPVKYKKLPGLLARIFMGSDLHKMFRYMNQNGFSVIDNIKEVRAEFDIQGDFKSWAKKHFKPA